MHVRSRRGMYTHMCTSIMSCYFCPGHDEQVPGPDAVAVGAALDLLATAAADEQAAAADELAWYKQCDEPSSCFSDADSDPYE